jgi:hypothetical protein
MNTIPAWLQDNFKWYRRLRGGRWAQWNGFWEREQLLPGLSTPVLYYMRDLVAMGIEGENVWGYKQMLHWDDVNISAREEY